MKILMALMGLEIGGAETHVVELSKALKNMGHEIVVTSNGGVYQKELEDYGIRHIKLPLHSKMPHRFLKSYFMLKKVFDNEHFDIVHAHARIPAYICGLLAKKYSFRYVTTAHWVFKITPLWKRLANWGEKTIAVSDDIKEYLIKNYGIWSDNISTTINGIDTKKFSKDTDWSDIKKEFGLQDDKYRILYVSRMDDTRSAVAFMTASAMPEILKIKSNAELIIVGDGNDFERLKAHTDAINAQIGHKAIILTGGRIDINKFVTSADAFVGVSRSALEAMATGIPVIIAGNEGYIGIFSEEKFKVSYDTNYCCRGCEDATTELVTRDLIKIITMSQEELDKTSVYNKQVIESYYSAQKMASDYNDMYLTLTPLRHYEHSDIIINGYYGYKNVGDDALLQAMIENVKHNNPDAKITVLSANPKETSSRYLVNSINRYNVLGIYREMKRAKLFISGGGSLLQDVTSTKSLIYYTSIIKLAKKLKLKVVIYANGFGPINKKKNIKKVKEALIMADSISMREYSSADAVKKLIPEKEVKISSDPAFSLTSTDDKWKARLLQKYGISDTRKYFAISLREWPKNDPKITEKLTEFCSSVKEKYGISPVFFAMQSTKDTAICNSIKKKLVYNAPIISDISAKEMISILEKMEFSIGMRLHFLIFSAVANVPVIGLSYDPKINSLIEYLDSVPCVTSNDLDTKKLLDITEDVLSNKDKYKSELYAKVEELKNKALTDAKDVIEIANNI